MKCSFEFENHPPCIVLNTKKYNYLDDLLKDQSGREEFKMISFQIECIEFNGSHINIRSENCINCFYCVFGCPGNSIEVNDFYVFKAMCSDYDSNYENRISEKTIDKIFNGEFINLPSIKTTQIRAKYKSFEKFTSVDETKNISIWGANCLKFLSSSINPIVSLEVGMKIKTRNRGGRLDICLKNDGYLFIAEAKVSFEKMMSENRYLSQMIAYEEEISSTLKRLNSKITVFKFLLIGGKESDLLPINHPECTSKVGNQSSLFYQNCINKNLFFISANALLSLGLKKLFKGDHYNLESCCLDIFHEENIGLLSSGIVRKDGEIRSLKF